jgi:hypothetical protein
MHYPGTLAPEHMAPRYTTNGFYHLLGSINELLVLRFANLFAQLSV